MYKFLLFLGLIHVALVNSQECYATGFCYCHLDPFLEEVNRKLLAGESIALNSDDAAAAIPTTTTEATTTTTEATTTTTEATTTTTEATTTTTTSDTISAETTANETTESTSTSTTTTTSIPITTAESAPEKLVLPHNGIIDPCTGKITFDIYTKASVGVLFNETNGKSENCSCNIESIVEHYMCLTNLKYLEDYYDLATKKSRKLVEDIIPWMHESLLAYDESQVYRNIEVVNLQNYDDVVQIVTRVSFIRTYQPTFHVDNALLSNLKGSRIKDSYKTSTLDDGCFYSVDASLPPQKEPSLLGSSRFVFLGLAIGLSVCLLLLCCIGRRDACSVKYW